ncbi:hypothetical protein HPB49_019988 [Dermacentor silvarum]|uniref:Uncharacterized protein n=1 Tax=Dermacentor silvarum TaxID=543639 RepID=A0ACB8DKE2_DERSI|nr:hypothetical protein HPB49_019988 [Dermacentor silvarum]
MADSRMEEENSEEDFGGQVATGRRSRAGKKSSDAANATRSNSQASGGDAATGGIKRPATKTAAIKNRIVKASRMPQLPEEDRKIIIRPRGGLNLSKVSTTAIGTAVIEASGLTADQASENVVCPNFTQNIVVVSTPEPDHATRELARSRSATRERSCSKSGGAQVRLEDGTPGANPTVGTTWADKVKGTVRIAGGAATPAVTESDDARIEQLIREVNSLRKANEELTKQVVELKKKAQPSPASVAVARPVSQSNEPSEGDSSPAPKKEQ